MPFLSLAVLLFLPPHNGNMVHLHGTANIRTVARVVQRTSMHEATHRPPDPQTLLSAGELGEKVGDLVEWMTGKRNILTLTGAGLSTESGIPDYRGNQGAYHNGHKPMIHDEFMRSSASRQRYWGRAMVGWRDFDLSQPNSGHYALANLENMNHIGVSFEDSIDFYPPDQQEDWTTSSGQRQLSVITQNVDHLHSRAGAQHVTELHGRTSRLRCMHCGYYQSRNYFHGQLEGMNEEWLRQVSSEKQSDDLRPDGDGNVHRDDYSDVCIPACPHCGGFFKPDVVFFGDSVPKHRVARCRAAVEASDGLLCIGTSLAVHSAFRFVKAAANSGVPIAILNVGETRAEAEGLDCLKIEAPIGSVLTHVVKHYEDNTHQGVHCNIRYQ